jgi:WD40 repeat protein
VLDGLGTVARTVRLSAGHLAAGAAGGRVGVWRADTWEPRAIWDAHDDEAAAVAFRTGAPATAGGEGTPGTAGREGVLATGGGDGRVGIWSLDGEPQGELELDGPVQALAWHPDGTRLLAAIGGPDAAIVALGLRAAA